VTCFLDLYKKENEKNGQGGGLKFQD